jgi:predicted nucleic acid-binding protein
MLVIDASVACKMYVREADSDLARAVVLGADGLCAPDFVVAEVASAMWRKMRSGQMSVDQATASLGALPGLFDSLAPCATLAPRAIAIADALGHPVYDCFYLALAERDEAMLVTADRRLLAIASGTPHGRLVMSLAAAAGEAR